MPQPPAKPASPGEFTTFMRSYQDMVFSTAARISGDRAQAQDIAQQVFLKAWEHFPELRRSPTAGGWLKTVATHLTLNHLSRYRRRWRFFSELPLQDDEAVADFPAPDSLPEDIDLQSRQAQVEEALQRLPEHQRVPLVLYHFEAMSYQEVATRLGVSLSKVKTDIMRGRAALVRAMQQP